jgi:hypothetical protein
MCAWCCCSERHSTPATYSHTVMSPSPPSSSLGQQVQMQAYPSAQKGAAMAQPLLAPSSIDAEAAAYNEFLRFRQMQEQQATKIVQ